MSGINAMPRKKKPFYLLSLVCRSTIPAVSSFLSLSFSSQFLIPWLRVLQQQQQSIQRSSQIIPLPVMWEEPYFLSIRFSLNFVLIRLEGSEKFRPSISGP